MYVKVQPHGSSNSNGRRRVQRHELWLRLMLEAACTTTMHHCRDTQTAHSRAQACQERVYTRDARAVRYRQHVPVTDSMTGNHLCSRYMFWGEPSLAVLSDTSSSTSTPRCSLQKRARVSVYVGTEAGVNDTTTDTSGGRRVINPHTPPCQGPPTQSTRATCKRKRKSSSMMHFSVQRDSCCVSGT